MHTPRARIPWVDTLKGVAIIMVVVQHLASRFDAELNPDGRGVWTVFSQFFIPLRMPLFFFLSGLVVAHAVTRGGPALRKRVLGPLYLYALWTTLFAARLVPAEAVGLIEDLHLGDFLTSLLLPTTFWYIYALAAYFTVCWVVARFGPIVRATVGVLALGLSFATAFFPEVGRDLVEHPWSLPQIPTMAANFVWFYAGVFGRDTWLRVAGHPRPGLAAALVGAYAAAYLAAQATGAGTVLEPVLSGIGLLALALVCERIPTGRTTRLLSHIGRNTLPVYLLHVVFISVAFEVITRTPAAALYAGNPGWLSLVSVPVFTALFIVGALLAGDLIRRSPLRFLLDPPAWVVGRNTRTPTHAAR